MLTFENTKVYGFEEAIRGMRNPKNSWNLSDSAYDENGAYQLGEKDEKLMTILCKAGTDHRKFMRFITVTTDITGPLYWWKEFDTYKVGTVANSCSTMHKIDAKPFEISDFSTEHLIPAFDKDGEFNASYSDVLVEVGDWEDNEGYLYSPLGVLKSTINSLNLCRNKYRETKDKIYWWQMIQLLPTSYNQRRTVKMNYEVLANIYKSRKGHKLDEWSVSFMDFISQLPYSYLITGEFDA